MTKDVLVSISGMHEEIVAVIAAAIAAAQSENPPMFEKQSKTVLPFT